MIAIVTKVGHGCRKQAQPWPDTRTQHRAEPRRSRPARPRARLAHCGTRRQLGHEVQL